MFKYKIAQKGRFKMLYKNGRTGNRMPRDNIFNKFSF